MSSDHTRRLIVRVCAAEILTMIGVFAYPALLPTFADLWSLSGAQSGWIAGIYFAGYAIAVPILLPLTDRYDAKWVYAFGAALAAIACIGFAVAADGFWTALAFRFIAGFGLGATYMPGLRVLVDRYKGPTPTRAIAIYTASFSLGTAVSYLVAGEVTRLFDWQTLFAVSGVAAIVAGALVITLPATAARPRVSTAALFDVRAVFANRAALGYIIAYGVHCWELFTYRSWLVAFLAFAVVLSPGADTSWLAPTLVAAASGLVATAASFGGNELCERFGRTRVIGLVLIASVVSAAGFGFAASLPYTVLAILALVYAAVIQLDSAALTAGAVMAAPADRKGVTLAVHALFGFGCAGVGPVVFGFALDAGSGGTTLMSWGAAFLTVAVVGVLAPIALRRLTG
jgi:MFS family permease